MASTTGSCRAAIMRPPAPASTEQNGATPAAGPDDLEIHGGPAAMYGYSFFMEFQLLAAQGYAVVYINPRGSTGYGRVFSGAVIKRLGRQGLRGHAGWGWIRRSRAQELDAPLDSARLGVPGGCYGGFMTNWIVGHTRPLQGGGDDAQRREYASRSSGRAISAGIWWRMSSAARPGAMPSGWRTTRRSPMWSTSTRRC